MTNFLVWVLFSLLCITIVKTNDSNDFVRPEDGRVTSLQPRDGSFNGGTVLTIIGTGFSPDDFSFDDPSLGNQVKLVSEAGDEVPCDKIETQNSQSLITCETRRPPLGRENEVYYLSITVDSMPFGTARSNPYCWGSCHFRFKDWRTPTIDKLNFQAGLPDQVLKISGKVYTDQMGRLSDGTGDNFDPEGAEISRVYIGGQNCDTNNEVTEEPFGLFVDDYSRGYIMCRPVNLSPGSYTVSFLIDPHGRSEPDDEVTYVDTTETIYQYQAHADVQSVQPEHGSLGGGTIVTITGKFFGLVAERVQVTVAGVPCDVLSCTETVITCRTQQGTDEQSDMYPGARGIQREIWPDFSDLSDVVSGTLDSSTVGYFSEKYTESAASPTEETYQKASETAKFVAKLTTVFVPPSSDYYTFYIRSDDKGLLYLSNTTSPLNKMEIASSPYYSWPSWTKYSSQKSDRMYLTGGMGYYMEALYQDGGGLHFINVGLHKTTTNLNHADVPMAVDEEQELVISSSRTDERQTITINDWTDGTSQNEEQLVVIQQCHMVNGVCNPAPNFMLNYAGHVTQSLPYDVTPAAVAQALNALPPITAAGSVSVTLESSDNTQRTYRVVFAFTEPDLTMLLRDATPDPYNGHFVSVTRDKAGLTTSNGFSLGLGGRRSRPIHSTSTVEQITERLEELFTTICTFSAPMGQSYFYQSYEGDKLGSESGSRLKEEEPYCGRQVLNNPSWIYHEGKTKRSPSSVGNKYNLQTYPQVCLAFNKKDVENVWLKFKVSYIDKSDRVKSKDITYDVDSSSATDWHHVCVDVYDFVANYDELTRVREPGKPLLMAVISITRGLLVDDVWIGRLATTVSAKVEGAKPNGHWIYEYSVSKASNVITIDMSPIKCGHNIPLFDIVGAQSTGGNGERDYTFTEFNSAVTVKREQAASPPITGTLDILYQETSIRDISLDTTAENLKNMLEDTFDVGTVAVTKTMKCYNYKWDVRWETKSGMQPLLQVNSSKLSGSNVQVTVNQEPGGLFFPKIPGEFLRMASTSPQAVVTVNGLVSSCLSEQCSFTYSSDVTPSITSFTPQNAAPGTVITVTGTKFSTNTNDVTVKVGNVVCNVESSTETQITFTLASDAPPGLQSIDLNIANTGNAVGQTSGLTVEMTVSSVNPSAGGTAGGSIIAITGTGFGTSTSGVSVEVGGGSCDISSVSSTTITCLTPAHADGVVHVVVSAEGTNAQLSDSFTYDSALQLTVTEITPTQGSVYGGSSLTIRGTAFPNISSQITVTIGGEGCAVQTATTTEIMCTIPRNPPGNAEVIVQTELNGRALFDGISSNYSYELTVTDLSPRRGSFNGGTEVTITGTGFSTDIAQDEVMFGDVSCTVFESTETEMKCRTARGSDTATVDNSGYHQEYGVGYAWNPHTVHIKAGDEVKWSWAAPVMVDVTYGVYQTMDESSSDYDGQGFQSSRSPTGSFTYQFNTPGTYQYSSGYIDHSDTIEMRGVVVVEPLEAKIVNADVEVDGFHAAHVLPHVNSSQSNEDDCQSDAVTSLDQTHFAFTFSSCATPVVTMVTPSSGPSSTEIVITGTGFGSTSPKNTITFGGHACTVSASTSTSITCSLDITSNPAPFEPFPVSVHVSGFGRALVSSIDNQTTFFALNPSVSTFQPSTGSKAGGTPITITGEGFVTEMSVFIGGMPCQDFTRVSYTSIQCTTPPSGNSDASTDDQTISIKLAKNGEQLEADCVQDSGCVFSYSTTQTPEVTRLTPRTINSADTVLTFDGSKFSNMSSDVQVIVGSEPCVVQTASLTQITCTLAGLTAGVHSAVVTIAGDKGRVSFTDPSMQQVTSEATLSSISPTQGSQNGGLTLNIHGNGFDATDDATTVTIGQDACLITEINTFVIRCRTPSQSIGDYVVNVISNGQAFPTQQFAVTDMSTPVISSVQPTTGKSGDSIIIHGTGFDSTTSNNHAMIGGTDCTITSSTTTSITCTLLEKPASTYPVSLEVLGKGLATSTTTFTYELTIDGVTPNESGFGGGRTITLTGSGFSSIVQVKICGNPCIIAKDYNVTDSTIECEVPPKTQSAPGADDQCSLTIDSPEASDSLSTIQAALPSAYTYKDALTSTITAVSPPRGGTGGGVRLTISGSGFSTTQNNNLVTIDGTSCLVVSATSTEIQCITGQHHRTIKTKVRVEVGTNGAAVQQSADFYYVDVWSSRYTWGGRDPPVEGDFVVIDKGQTMVLDVDTPCLAFLLIKGGTFIFDDEQDIHLQSKFILITHGGSFMIGTEEAPFQHKATVTIHGHVRSKEIPVYGAKSIALREGYLGLHGKHVLHTWTVITETVNPGDTSLKLQDPVTWQLGDKIVIAPTGKNIREHEEVTIVGILDGGRHIQVDPPLQYRHICIVQTFSEKVISTCAEVGLLTRNVVIQGSQHDQWSGTIKACLKAFEPGQFQTQTCFLGKFGQEPGSDEFGVQIMIHNPVKSAGRITAHFDHIEVRHAGQSFRIGRYPIHFHVTGDVHGSYVKGCSIHHTFNRAVTMHGVNYLVVERNVFYHTRGNSFFMEDGIEIANTVRYNLGIFVTPSTSTLNVDITPAAYWVTNANNTVTDNVAAGVSHFGFWYQMFEHPDGPSFTPDVCPRNVPMAPNGFKNNTAHTCGRYGLWVFPIYHPKVGGHCNSKIAEPAEFHSLLSWNNMRGAEGVQLGAVRFVDFVMMDNDLAGIEYIDASSDDAPWGGPMIKDSLIIGSSLVSQGLPRRISTNRNCTETGLMLPKSSKLTVSNVTLVNFDNEQCVALATCAHCKIFQGGWMVKFDKMTFTNAPRKTRFKWKHEAVLRDLDGSLTGTVAGSSIVPSNNNLPPSACSDSPQDSFGSVGGSVCDDTVDFRRMAWNEASPSSLNTESALLKNEHGTDAVPWKFKGITHPKGWTTTLIVGNDYELSINNFSHITNISYSASYYEFGPNDFVRIEHVLKQEPDFFKTVGTIQDFSELVPPTSGNHGDWGFENDTKTLSYLVTGKDNTRDENNNLATRDIRLQVYRCFFMKCIVPTIPPITEGRPMNPLFWSQPGDWNKAETPTEAGYGGYNGVLPKDNENVLIRSDWWMVADTQLPLLNRLYIQGVLELENDRDHVLRASVILIMGERARLILGWKDDPYPGNALISLQGNHDSEDMPLNDGPNVGAKAIGVFGILDLHGKPRDVYWTRLSATANTGDSSITLQDNVENGNGWEVGDEIVIASTTFEAGKSETARIASVSQNTVTLETAIQHKHISHTHTLPDGQRIMLAAEVGLLTRNIKIEGADNPAGAIPTQDFGCRVIVGKATENGVEYTGKGRIENVEFKNCGQRGWTDFYDPRYSLAFLDVGTTSTNDSYVKGNAFNYNFNSALGIFGTNNLLVEDNVVYFTLGASIRIWGEMNRAVHNLVVYSASESTYKGARLFDLRWPGSIETESAVDPVLIDNAVAGSDHIGYLTDGEPCDIENNSPRKWRGNTVHGALQGISIMYTQGLPECSKISGFQVWKNYDWGLFTYTKSRVVVDNVTFAENTNSINGHVYSPAALSHVAVDKYFHVERCTFIGRTSSWDCAEDSVAPASTVVNSQQRAIRPPGGGLVALLLADFQSSKAGGPKMRWDSAMSYPAIYGSMKLADVTFSSFGTACGGQRDYVMMPNRVIGDLMHPVTVQGISKFNVDEQSLLFYNVPTTKWINPSDCVDMDCDGLRQLLITDKDGSFSGQAGNTLIPKAEYQWGGNPSFGLGDYRIPTPAQTAPDGSRLDVNTYLPHKGIIRGTKDTSQCTWKDMWNAYMCSNMDHHMAILESLDADTETRRLSPVAIMGDGYVNLLNGPMDHGWCLGYTCQERISTFYGIVAANRNYSVYFTSTNPQKIRLHLLAEREKAVRFAIFYKTTQRLDIYRQGIYINPMNAILSGERFTLKKKDPALPKDQFEPQLHMFSGANYWDRDTHLLYVIVRGTEPIDIRTSPVIQVRLDMAPIPVDDFFEEKLVENLAALLGIDKSKIRVMNVVSADGSRRRRAVDNMQVEFEIGDPPEAEVEYEGTAGNSTEGAASNYTGPTNATSFGELLNIASNLVDHVQTGALAASLNTTVNTISVTDPVPEPVDPTGGVRATNETGGVNGTGNDTLRYDQVMSGNDAGVTEHVYGIPTTLVIVVQPMDAEQDKPFAIQPKLMMHDSQGNALDNVGFGEIGGWVVTATIRAGTGHPSATFVGNNTTQFLGSYANFTVLSISHNGTGYIIDFHISKPDSAVFTTSSQPFDVREPSTSPRFFTPLSDSEVQETAAVGTLVLQVSATAMNGPVEYFIISGNSLGFFEIISSSGEIRVKKSLDLETESHAQGEMYNLVIEARDQNSPPLTGNVTLNIHVASVNEFDPTLTTGSMTKAVSENSMIGTVLVTINATDQDSGDDGRLEYFIVSGNNQGDFGINNTTGAIYLVKELDYKIIKEYSLGIKIEDSGPVDQRRSITVQFTINISFLSHYTVNPEVVTELELRFPNVDYSTVIVGSEQKFITSLKSTLDALEPGTIYVHFELSEGSVLATFELITRESNVTSILDKMAAQVTSTNGLSVSMDGQTYTANRMKADGDIYGEATQTGDDDSIMMIIVICAIVGALFLICVIAAIVLACNAKDRRSKRKVRSPSFVREPHHGGPWYSNSSPDELSTRTSRASIYGDIPLSNRSVPVMAGSVERDESYPSHAMSAPMFSAFRATSPPVDAERRSIRVDRPPSDHTRPQSASHRSSRRSSTGSRDPTIATIPLATMTPTSPRSWQGSAVSFSSRTNPVYDDSPLTNGFQERHHDGFFRKMQVNLVKPHQGRLFHKLGELNVNLQWSLKELRQTLDKQLANKTELRKRQYVFIDNDMNNMPTYKEEDTVVGKVFKTYIKVKILHGTDGWLNFCQCGKIASTWCKKCSLRGYCSPECMEKDKKEHNVMCEPNVELLRKSLDVALHGEPEPATAPHGREPEPPFVPHGREPKPPFVPHGREPKPPFVPHGREPVPPFVPHGREPMPPFVPHGREPKPPFVPHGYEPKPPFVPHGYEPKPPFVPQGREPMPPFALHEPEPPY